MVIFLYICLFDVIYVEVQYAYRTKPNHVINLLKLNASFYDNGAVVLMVGKKLHQRVLMIISRFMCRFKSLLKSNHDSLSCIPLLIISNYIQSHNNIRYSCKLGEHSSGLFRSCKVMGILTLFNASDYLIQLSNKSRLTNDSFTFFCDILNCGCFSLPEIVS